MQLARANAKARLLLAAAFLLGGCATMGAPPAPPSVPPPVMTPSPPPSPPPASELVQPPAATRPPIAMPEMIAPPPLSVPKPPPPLPTDAQSLRAAYGTPDFIRKEMDSELWRYDGRNCAAFFFLYREGDAMRIRYTETNPRGKTAIADPDCLESLSGRPAASSSRPMS
jgi:hypothetical protein